MSLKRLTSLPSGLQEAKEALASHLVEATVAYVRGDGEHGEAVYAALPQRRMVSGFLMPRYDGPELDDESSDIRVCSVGIDTCVRRSGKGKLTVTPSFNVYVRVFPTWEDLSRSELGLWPSFRLAKDVKKQVDDVAKAQLDEFIKRLNDGKPLEAKKGNYQHNKRIRELARKEALIYALGKLGIVTDAKALVDLNEKAGIPATGQHDADAAAAEAGVDHDETDREERLQETQVSEDPKPTIGKHQVVVIRGGLGIKIKAEHVAPAQMPMKWRRIEITGLPSFEWDIAAGLEGKPLREAADAFGKAVVARAYAVFDAWIASEDGHLWGWRDGTITPEHVETEEAWNRRLDELRTPFTTETATRIRPVLDRLTMVVAAGRDMRNPDILSLRIAMEQNSVAPQGKDAMRKSACVFQAGLEVSMDMDDHVPLRLDRIEPSYRFRRYMTYDAMGLNCGVVARKNETDGRIVLKTTSAPTWGQPRIQPAARSDKVPTQWHVLMKDHAPEDFLDLVVQYRRYIDTDIAGLESEIVAGLAPEEADRERERLHGDMDKMRQEAALIERGIRLLIESRNADRKRSAGDRSAATAALAAPWRAWILTNETMYERLSPRNKAEKTWGWRLFQMAFVLAHIPILASRMPEFAGFYAKDHSDETVASLLYFPTGGGKSEAFYGTLIFNLFFDRLRGKERGVTAMIRYPLRLLTLQQAQRLLRILVHAEIIRKREDLGFWPFEIGFWVGSGNTPNWMKEVPSAVPLADKAMTIAEAEDAEASKFIDCNTSWNKVPFCPCCGEPTALVRHKGDHPVQADVRLAIVCFNDACAWNRAHDATRHPLPFLLTDDTIYQRAPSVILGTIDKMAMFGHSHGTGSKVAGMFGTARWMSANGHLHVERVRDKIVGGPEENLGAGAKTVHPAYASGTHVFKDPFPSLIIQDEAHLLEESLGTFSALFETLVEGMLLSIFDVAGAELQCAQVPGQPMPRMPRIIAASATVSEPDRQLEVLYQRTALQFPCPGPDIYTSFHSQPAPLPPEAHPDRRDLEARLASAGLSDPERTAPRMRTYVSIMTNGAPHTTTSVAVIAAFHLAITRLWNALTSGDADRMMAAAERIRDVQVDDDGRVWRAAAVQKLIDDGRHDILAELVDLHRISLTYVTNKKSGDMVADALDAEVKRLHRLEREPIALFQGDLISGGVGIAEIQEIMAKAEASAAGTDGEFPPIDDDGMLRNIVATAAISHGVDVDRFNSMFFAGLPSDIAEYIQASSRVGRTHVGFVMLIPTPQSRRDRYVVETHDIFHRFLERMIAPPAVERWAEDALARTLASFIVCWSIIEEFKCFKELSDTAKDKIRAMDTTTGINSICVSDPTLLELWWQHVAPGIGLEGHPISHKGAPDYRDHYVKEVRKHLHGFAKEVVAAFMTTASLTTMFANTTTIQTPMTSLRDVDEAGLIIPVRKDSGGTIGTRAASYEALYRSMQTVMQKKGALVFETGAEGDVSTGGAA